MKHGKQAVSFFIVALVVAACSQVKPPELAPTNITDIRIERITVNLERTYGGCYPVDCGYRVVSGNSFNVTARIDRPAPAGGLAIRPVQTFPFTSVVSLSPIGQSAYRIPAGEQEVTFRVDTVPTQDEFESNTIYVYPGNSFYSERIYLEILPNPQRPAQTLEAENARLRGATQVDQDYSYFSENAAVNFRFGGSSSATFTVNVDKTGAYDLVLVYAQLLGPSFDSNHVVTLKVNGKSTQLRLAQTPGNGDSAAVKRPIRVNLLKGKNVVTLSSARGGFALDRLETSPVN